MGIAEFCRVDLFLCTATISPPGILKACLADNNITLRWMVSGAKCLHACDLFALQEIKCTCI